MVQKNDMAVSNRGASQRNGCGTRDSNALWLNFDPCGVICAALVYIINWGCAYGTHVQVLGPWLGNSLWYYFHSAVLMSIVILGSLCHMRAMMSNPGAVPSTAKPLDPAHWERHCHKCNNFKPPRAHHCSVCRRCVIKMDHHCPWINNCVGLGNHKYFILFVCYVLMVCLYSLMLIFFRFISCISPTATCDTSPGQGIGMIGLTIVAILFGLFTGCLLIDQVTSISSNTTQIDRMKGETRRQPDSNDIDDRKQVWHNLGEVFGGDPARDGIRWTWFLPVPVQFHNPESLRGYCFRDCPKPRTSAEMEMV